VEVCFVGKFVCLWIYIVVMAGLLDCDVSMVKFSGRRRFFYTGVRVGNRYLSIRYGGMGVQVPKRKGGGRDM
jgi:hypothetical protein